MFVCFNKSARVELYHHFISVCPFSIYAVLEQAIIPFKDMDK